MSRVEILSPRQGDIGPSGRVLNPGDRSVEVCGAGGGEPPHGRKTMALIGMD